MDVVIWAWWRDQEWNPPQSGHRETDEDDTTWKLRRPKKLADREEVRNASESQTNQERRCANTAARTGK
jgi:hypothetical protein